MEDKNLTLLKKELSTQLDSYGFNDAAKEIFNHIGKSDMERSEQKGSEPKFTQIESAKNEWESCVDALEHHAVIILDENLKVIRANRTIELWGWAEVNSVRGTHILNLITPALQHASSNEWIDEWCQLDTQSNAEWVSTNVITAKSYRFSFFPNRDIDSTHHTENCYAAMLVSDITDQNTLSDHDNDLHLNNNISGEDGEETELIRLSAYRLHQLANKLIRSQEDERKRVSSELHDGLGQTLSALKYKVELAVIESENDTKPDDKEAVLKDILESVTVALRELRQVSSDLRPSVLDDLGVILALKWFANEYNKIYTKLNIEFQINIIETDIPDKNKSIIYRIVQEAMNNISKHSDAKNIYVSLTKSESGILLRIKDDGSGFDLEKVKRRKKSGVGLKSMEERAVNSGAKYTIKSNALSGTVVQVFWESD